MYSWELKPGDIKPVTFMGRELVAFRTNSGVASVLDAYCPHLGANLAVTSRLRGDCLECPFHGWQFNTDGKCVSIPGQTMIPSQAHSKAWRIEERNQMILLWFHVENLPPTWHVPAIPEIDDLKAWRLDCKSDFIVGAHIQEIPENTADVAHLNMLHHLPYDTPIVEDHFRMDWQGWWRPGKEEDKDPHCAHVPVRQYLELFGRPIPFMHMTTQIHLIGPGLVLYYFETPVGKMRLFETLYPTGPLTQRVSLTLFSAPWTVRFFTKWFYRGVAKTLSQDCWIWNSKTYFPHPTLAKGDRYLMTFRKWFSQFYCEKSQSLQEASRAQSLDW